MNYNNIIYMYVQSYLLIIVINGSIGIKLVEKSEVAPAGQEGYEREGDVMGVSMKLAEPKYGLDTHIHYGDIVVG